MKGLAILGSTGSIGRTALAVVARHPDRFRVIALTAHHNHELLERQVQQVVPSYVGMAQPLGAARDWQVGPGCLREAACRPDVDIVINAVVGVAGLDATLAALESGKRVALANKESLVVAGELALAAARRGGGEIVPVDSEHSAILQCLGGRPASEVRRLVLTASGGPFRGWNMEQLARATLTDALKHPTWEMGRKITVDSATLANKGLEVIEAHLLFQLPYEAIEVVVHPQSIVHSLVEFVDGSVIAQLGAPSMELPILYALTHPNRINDAGTGVFDPVRHSPLSFEAVRMDDFPALKLGVEAGRRGGAAPAVFNAANERAVALFLEQRITFMDIPRAIAAALDRFSDLPGMDREQLLAADAAARAHVDLVLAC